MAPTTATTKAGRKLVYRCRFCYQHIVNDPDIASDRNWRTFGHEYTCDGNQRVSNTNRFWGAIGHLPTTESLVEGLDRVIEEC